MRKAKYLISKVGTEVLSKPLEVIIEQTEDKRWKASTGDIHVITDDRNVCLQSLLKKIGNEKEVSTKKKYKL